LLISAEATTWFNVTAAHADERIGAAHEGTRVRGVFNQ